MRLKHRAGAVALLTALGLTATSCTLREDQHYKVTTGWGIYAHIYGNPSWQLATTLYHDLCHQSITCTSMVLNDRVRVSGWGAAEFHHGIRRWEQFRAGIIEVRQGGWSSGWDSGAKCLVLHKSPSGNLTWSTEWIEPIDYNDDCWGGDRL